MTGPRALVALAIAAGALSALPVEASVGTGSGDDGVAVIAFVGESALDVLHVDLRARPGASSPSPAAAPVVGVGLPHRGSYADRQRRVAAGPLGHLQPGVVYAIAGTRLPPS